MEPFLKFANIYGAHLFASRQGYSEYVIYQTYEVVVGEDEEGEPIIEERQRKVKMFRRSFFQLKSDGQLSLYVFTGEKFKAGELVSETQMQEDSFTERLVLEDLIEELEQVSKRRASLIGVPVEAVEKKPLSQVVSGEPEGTEDLSI